MAEALRKMSEAEFQAMVDKRRKQGPRLRQSLSEYVKEGKRSLAEKARAEREKWKVEQDAD